MSKQNADEFVKKLRENRDFRKKIAEMRDIKSIKTLLEKEGLVFDEQELMAAMITCMEGLDAMMAGCCPGKK